VPLLIIALNTVYFSSTLMVGTHFLALLATFITLRPTLSASRLVGDQVLAITRIVPAHDLAEIVLGSVRGLVPSYSNCDST
jgi:hypothetical protein